MSSAARSSKVRPIKSCLTCSKRKVRCDRGKPCGECEPRSLRCVYQADLVDVVQAQPPKLAQFKDRKVVNINATKALDQYWSVFRQNGQGVHRLVSHIDVFGPSPLAGPVTSLIPPPRQAMELVWAGQASNVLHMFSVAADMTMPYFRTHFNPQLATIYWKFLTRPVHVDLTEGFDDPSWRLEQSMAWKRKKESLNEKGSFAVSRSRTLPHEALMLDDTHSTPVYTDLSRNQEPFISTKGQYRPNPSLFEPSFAPDEQGLFQAATGRRFDAMTDFLFLKSPRVEDIMSLLEYGVAFLRGSSLLGWTEVNDLFAFNVERIIHTLLHRLRLELDLNLVDRLVNCISIFALHREFTGQFSTIAPYMMMAFNLAVEHDLHRIDPGNISRLILTVLYYTEIPARRKELEKVIMDTFPTLPGIELRLCFSYVSGALLTPETEPEAQSLDFWKEVEQYLLKAEMILPHLDMAVDLPAPCTILFKCLFATMRAELGPRIGHNEWPVQQACLMASHLCSLEDFNTFIAVGLLVRYRIHSRRSSVYFNIHGRRMLVSDYLAEQVQNIPTMPVVSIIPGEEPNLIDTAQILASQLPIIPTEPLNNLSFADSTSDANLPTLNQSLISRGEGFGAHSHFAKGLSHSLSHPFNPFTAGKITSASIPTQMEPESPDTSSSSADMSHLGSSSTEEASSTTYSASSFVPTPANTLEIINSSPFLKDTGTPEAPIVKKDSTESKTLIGY